MTDKKKTTNLKEIRELIDLLHETNLGELEIQQNGQTIRLRSKADMPAAAAPTAIVAPTTAPAATPAAPAAPANTFDAPMVGTFYRAASPEADPFVTEGATVKKGQTLCVIEAMKTFNQIEADRAGVVRKIMVEDAQPVEFGQALFVIE